MVNLGRYAPAWANRAATNVKTSYTNHKTGYNVAAATVAAAVIIGGGFAAKNYSDVRVEAARQEERQAAADREAQLKAQLAAQQRAAGRRTGIQALFGVGRYPSNYSTAQMLAAGYSGRVTSIDENGNETQSNAGLDAQFGGGFDSTARIPTRLLRDGAKNIPVVRYFTAALDGTWGVVTGILPDFLTGADSAIRGANSVKPASYGNKPAVNDVDPASRELGVVKVVSSGFRAWRLWSVFHGDSGHGDNNNNNGNGNNNGNTDVPEPDLQGIIEGGDHITN